MFSKISNFLLVVALFAIWEPQAGNTQFFPERYNPSTGSVSRASSTASERRLGFGGLGFSQGISDAETVTRNNGGYQNGGTTSVARSQSRRGEVNLGGLGIGSTFTNSETRNNGEVSRALSHDFNIGGLGIGTSLSRDNLHNGPGLQRSPNGGLLLGLGPLNIDLSRKQQRQEPRGYTQAQAEGQGIDVRAGSFSDSDTYSRQLGGLDFTNTHSRSDAISSSAHGQTSASAGGLAGGSATNFNSFGGLFDPRGFFRTKREAGAIQRNYAFKTPKPASFHFHLQSRRHQQNQSSPTTLEIVNDSAEINWPTHDAERQQKPTQQIHPQQLHYSPINSNSSTEQFAPVDENKRLGRTFTFITDLINRFTEPKCVYPCTLDAYQEGRCCQTIVVPPQPLPSPSPPTVLIPPLPTLVLPPSLQPQPTLLFPLIPIQCCNSCLGYGYYGPPPCIRYTSAGGGPGYAAFYLG